MSGRRQKPTGNSLEISISLTEWLADQKGKSEGPFQQIEVKGPDLVIFVTIFGDNFVTRFGRICVCFTKAQDWLLILAKPDFPFVYREFWLE